MTNDTLALLLSFPIDSSVDNAVQYVCKQWAWVGDVYNRKVYCLDWRIKE